MSRITRIKVVAANEPANRNKGGEDPLEGGLVTQNPDAGVISYMGRDPLVSGELKIDEELEPCDARSRFLFLNLEVGIIHGQEDDEAP